MVSLTQEMDPEERSSNKSTLAFPIIGIGASAGGLTALQRFLPAFEPDTGMAFVVVMHLAPDRESMLGTILQRDCRMPVVTVTERTQIEADHVYVISPALALEMSDGHLSVAPQTAIEKRRRAIDTFFRSLAFAHRERAIGIVLSGSGDDGAQGLKRLKETGGVAIAQSPEDAEFNSMPNAAIESGAVDFVLPVAEMPSKLTALWNNARSIQLPDPPADLDVQRSSPSAEMLAEEALQSIKALLRERTGHDFANYKRGTVLPRLERRMQVRSVPDLVSYRKLLESDKNETHALLQDMLISVTNFLRDPAAFESLSNSLKEQVKNQSRTEPYRAWIAGCATGEEAYSVAIVLQETLHDSRRPITIFASDIDQRAITAARVGLYPGSITADLNERRLRDFFKADPQGFRVTKTIRDCIVFSVHNMLGDAAFTRMDLICCRNVLIYLNREAQEQVLKSFHFALQPGGLLFLGSAETADACPHLFEALDKSNRVYRVITVKGVRQLPPLPSRVPVIEPLPVHQEIAVTANRPLALLHERVLRELSPASILVDSDDTVLHVSERAFHLLRLPEGAPTSKLMALARVELRAELRAVISRAFATGKSAGSAPISLQINGQAHWVVLSARPSKQVAPQGLVLVVFDEFEENLAPDGQPGATRNPVIEALETELQETQNRLRGMVGESTTSTEELRASNEELQTINEELRSTTEELETSREELHALNEELSTVNAELTIRIDEAAKANDDFQNLMTSVDIGTVFVDRQMLLKRFTPQAASLFNLLPADIGRPLMDIRHRLDYEALSDDISDVLRDLKRVDREVRSDRGRWYMVQIAPYRTTEDKIEGAVIALVDVTARRNAEDQLRATERRMARVAESMRDYAIITMDAQGVMESWSKGAERIFGYTEEEAVGQPFLTLFVPEERQTGEAQNELQRAMTSGRCDDDRWHLRKDGQRIFCSGITTPMHLDGRHGFAKIARDITDVEVREQRRNQALASERIAGEKLQQANTLKDQFLAMVSHELKNPLSIIQMNAQLLSHAPGIASNPRMLRSAHSIVSAVSSQSQLVNDLLELSRANVGKVTLAPAVVDVADLVRNVLDAARSDALAKGIALVDRIESAPMFVDPIRIEQIVWNLVGNAIKFTPDGGTLEVTLASKDFVVKLEVADSGIGIKADELPHIFDMFRQAGNAATLSAGGLGIGLALVKQLAELHHGSVEAQSSGIGRGTTFKVKLPRVMGKSDSQDVANNIVLAGARLLVIDDDPDYLYAFAELLTRQGALVTAATNAEDGLAHAKQSQFDLITTDAVMSGHDGFWLQAQLAGDPATSNIPVFAITGIGRLKALAAGFKVALDKPLDLEAFKREVGVALAVKKF